MTRTLVIDTDKERAANTEFYLQKEGYKTSSITSNRRILAICIGQCPDLVLLSVADWRDDALNTLIELKSCSKTKNIPVIVLTQCDEPQTLIYTLDLGAYECVALPADSPVLAAKIRSVLGVSQRLMQLDRSNRELQQLASTDALTHVYNRRHFFNNSNAEFARAKRYSRELSIIMLDLDEFKSVNDRYGHAAGDMALVALAECCRNVVRESDIVGRLGGEEFAICCPEADLDGAIVIAERIRIACEQTLLSFHEAKFCVTVSLGVTRMVAADNSIEEIMQRADKLLYQAKSAGRNCSLAK